MNYQVLIVEDDQNYRFALRTMYQWQENGFQIAAEALHGLQALEFLKEEHFDLVITDMSMPMMNGLELIRNMKEKYTDIPIIVLSAYDDFPFVKESLKLGALDYILKQEMTTDSIAKALEEAKIQLKKATNAQPDFQNTIKKLLSNQPSSEDAVTVPAEVCMKLSSIVEYVHSQTRKISQTLPNRSVIDLLYLNIYFDVIQKFLPPEERTPLLLSLAKELHAQRLVLEKENCLLMHFKSFWQGHIILLTGKTREINRTLEYIHEHYAEDLSLSILSDCIGLSANYLSNLFKTETGENLTQYINSVRIEKAKYLMKNTSLKVYEIAHAVGYNTPTYFSNMFKKITNLSVIEYKRSLQE